MMGNDQTISRDLYDLLTTQNFDPEITDQQGKPSQPDEGRIYKFDYIGNSGKNYGTAVLVVGEDNDLMFFFGDNLGKSMEEPDKTDWFQFLQQLSQFATEHRYTWSPKDLNRFKHTMAGMAAISEGLFEGYYGTRKKSYVGEPTEARLVINHNRMIGENDKRYRYVESLFIETVDGERFKLPFTKLAGGNAMLEHVRQGGRPYDIRGVHITDIVNEMSVLGRFNRARQNRVFEGVTQELVEQAENYYKALKENLKHLGSSRGYKKYFESWSPADITTEEALVEDLKTLFVEQSIDARIEAALPTLAKIQQGAKMKEADIFESWVNNLAEGTWALPDNPEAQAKLDELMSKELIVGPDATNATEQLYDIIGDDKLFDILGQLADRDARANIWDDTDVQARLKELGIQLNTTPDAMAEPEVTPPTGDEELKEGHMADVDLILQDVANGDEDIYRVYSSPRTAEEQYASKIIGDMYDEVVIDKHLHPDDDFEQILDIVADRLAQEHSVNEADNTATFVEQGVAEDEYNESKIGSGVKRAEWANERGDWRGVSYYIQDALNKTKNKKFADAMKQALYAQERGDWRGKDYYINVASKYALEPKYEKFIEKFKQIFNDQNVAEGEYDDPRWEPREPDMSRKVDWDIEAERNKPEEPETAKTVTITDNSGKVVLTFPSTGGFYGDLRFAASKGFDTDSGDYHMNWKKDVAEDGSNEMGGRNGVWDSFYESDELARIKQLALLK